MKRSTAFGLPLLGVLALLGLTQCELKEDLACTMEFRTVGIQVNDAPLNRFYTLRLERGDTIIHEYDSILPGYYTVLNDQAMAWLKGREENFRFEGWRNDTLVVTADFRIGADRCHIYKVSGPTNWP